MNKKLLKTYELSNTSRRT